MTAAERAARFHRDRAGDGRADLEDAGERCLLLPDIAREGPPDGDPHTITGEVRDEAGRTIRRGAITREGTRS